ALRAWHAAGDRQADGERDRLVTRWRRVRCEIVVQVELLVTRPEVVDRAVAPVVEIRPAPQQLHVVAQSAVPGKAQVEVHDVFAIRDEVGRSAKTAVVTPASLCEVVVSNELGRRHPGRTARLYALAGRAGQTRTAGISGRQTNGRR